MPSKELSAPRPQPRREELTKARVEGYKVSKEEGRAVWHDTKLVGFGIRVSWTGTKTWQVLYRVKGSDKKCRKDLGRYPAVTLADARTLAKEVLLEADRGRDLNHEAQEAKQAPTFGDITELYLEKYAKPNKRTWERDKELLDRNVLPKWKHLKAHDIKRRDVVLLLDGIAQEPRKGKNGRTYDGAPIAANRTLAVIRKVFNWAISRDLVEHNPCTAVQAPTKENQRDRVLSDAEIRTLWAAFEKQSELMGAIFKLRLLTAQRGAEVEAMRWADVDLKAGWWTVPAEVAKNGLSHRVPLSTPAREILQRLEAVSGGKEWVFPSKKGKPDEEKGEDAKKKPEHISWVQPAVQRIRKETGVNFVAHDLRRTAATYMASLGVSRLTISKVLNHAEAGVTKIYDRHSYDAEKRQALDLWAERLQAITSAAN